MNKNAPLASVLFACLMATAISGCDNLEDLDQKVTIKLDPAISADAKAMLHADVLALASYKLNASPTSYFAKTFGGTQGSDVLKFMDDRVNYIVPEIKDLTSRLKLGPISLPSLGGDAGIDDPRAVMMAANIGMGLYLVNEANPLPINLRFKIGDTAIPMTSPRVGLMELGPGYTMTETPSGKPITAIIRTETLVHEARHSDCTGGLTTNDVARLRAGEMPENHDCGHTHVACPAGHPLEGLPACDDRPWGAYTVGALYTQEIARSCENCTELERQQAIVDTTDSFSRVLVLQDMLDGKYGDPDMSSSDEVRKSDSAVRAMLDAISTERNAGNTAPASFITE